MTNADELTILRRMVRELRDELSQVKDTAFLAAKQRVERDLAQRRRIAELEAEVARLRSNPPTITG